MTVCQRFNNGDEQFVVPKRSGAKCKANGEYEEIQCDDDSKECWCVDQNGYEVAETRTTGTINCPEIGNCFYSLAPPDGLKTKKFKVLDGPNDYSWFLTSKG